MPDLLLILLVVGGAVVLFLIAYAVTRSPRQPPPVRPRGPEPEPSGETEGDANVGEGTTVVERPEAEPAPPAPEPTVEPEVEPEEEISLADRFKARLTRTRNVLGTTVADLFGRGVTDEAWERLEESLIAADVGVETSLTLVEDVRRRAKEEGVTDADGVRELLKDELKGMLAAGNRDLARASADRPTVWLVTGVNGTGKTTSIGKIAAQETREGRSVVLGASDTFRAAAIEQLGTWAERSGSRLVRQEQGSDPAAVAYDAYMAAKATDADVLMVDTAGRLHNKRELMEELTKTKRVLEKQAGEVQETLLVLDATTGQNGVAQAQAFLDAVDVTGLILTKLDGTSKGGIVVAVQRQLGIPVKLIGVGEDIDDLAPFDAEAFVDALFADTHEAAA